MRRFNADFGYSEAMGTRTVLSVEEYLHTSFPDLDREYRDGEVVERSLPDFLHGKVQGLLFAFFFLLRKRMKNIYRCTETRLRLDQAVF